MPADTSGRREIVEHLPGVLTLYSDGSFERLSDMDRSASAVVQEGVASRDVIIDASAGIWVRIFLPLSNFMATSKIPVVLHFHGGGFCFKSPRSPPVHDYCTLMAQRSGCIWITVNYRLAPEHPLPAAYEDAYASLVWLRTQAQASMERNEDNDVACSRLHQENGQYSCRDEAGKVSCPGHHTAPKDALNLQEYGVGDDTSKQAALLGAQGKEGEFNVDKGSKDRPWHDHAMEGVVSSCPELAQNSSAKASFDFGSNDAIRQNDQALLAGEVDQWLAQYADFSSCFLAGDSAGGTIVHFVAAQAAGQEWSPLQVKGLLLMHPAFPQEELQPSDELTKIRVQFYHKSALPPGAPFGHPLMNPLHSESPIKLSQIKLPPLLVAVAEKDPLRYGGLAYFHALLNSGHDVELFQSQGVGHCFYIKPGKPLMEAEMLENAMIHFINKHAASTSPSLSFTGGQF